MNLEKTPVVTVGVDGSAASKTALAWAASFARRHGAGLRTVTAWQYPATLAPEAAYVAVAASDVHEIAAKVLDEAVDEVVGAGCAERVVAQGSPARALLEESHDAGLLVVGRRGSGGFLGTGLGSTSRQCATHADVPVAIVGDETPPLPTDPRALVAVDGSEHSINALVWALGELAAERPVVAVYSHDEWILDEVPADDELARRLHDRAQERLADVADEARARTGGTTTLTALEVCVAGVPLAGAVVGRTVPAQRIDLRVVHGDPRTTVWDVAEAERADVVVVGARGRTGPIGAILGSFTTHAVHHCPDDVALVVVP